MKESGRRFDFAVLLTVYLPDIISNFLSFPPYNSCEVS